MKPTLQEYLAISHMAGIIDHSLRATMDDKGNVSFYIRPDSKDGNTADFVVIGNRLELPRKTVAEILRDGNLCPWCERRLTEHQDHDSKAHWFTCTTNFCGFESNVEKMALAPEWDALHGAVKRYEDGLPPSPSEMDSGNCSSL